jgi:hypothetical protein
MQLELQSLSHITKPVNPDRPEALWEAPRYLPHNTQKGFAVVTKLEILVKLALADCSRIQLNSLKLSCTVSRA